MLYSIETIPHGIIERLFKDDPVTHLFLKYDVELDRENSELCFDSESLSYLLAWFGSESFTVAVLRGSDAGVLLSNFLGTPQAKRRSKILIQTKQSRPLPVQSLVKKEESFLEMLVDRQSFVPFTKYPVTRLTENEASVFSRIQSRMGRTVGIEESSRLLSKQCFYGIYEGGELVSVAGTHFFFEPMWFVGWVSTLPSHEGRGFAKCVTSKLTSDGLKSGAKLMLRVREGNERAIMAYKRLGYKIVGKERYCYIDAF